MLRRTLYLSSFMERASNGTVNVVISYNRQPSAHESDRKPYGLRQAQAKK